MTLYHPKLGVVNFVVMVTATKGSWQTVVLALMSAIALFVCMLCVCVCVCVCVCALV